MGNGEGRKWWSCEEIWVVKRGFIGLNGADFREQGVSHFLQDEERRVVIIPDKLEGMDGSEEGKEELQEGERKELVREEEREK